MSPEQVPDLVPEVGRHGLRTFEVSGGRLKSLYREHYWDAGTAVAVCMGSKHCPSAPGVGCSCGLYSLSSYDRLLNAYGNHARYNVAVVTVEGRTEVCSRGTRCAASRIVGFWTNGDQIFDHAYARHAPGAKRFDTIAALLNAYKFNVPDLTRDSWGYAPTPATARSQISSSPSMTAALQNHLRLYPQDRQALLDRFGWLPDVPAQPSSAPATLAPPIQNFVSASAQTVILPTVSTPGTIFTVTDQSGAVTITTPPSGMTQYTLPNPDLRTPGNLSAPVALPSQPILVSKDMNWDNPTIQAMTPGGRAAIQGILNPDK